MHPGNRRLRKHTKSPGYSPEKKVSFKKKTIAEGRRKSRLQDTLKRYTGERAEYLDIVRTKAKARQKRREAALLHFAGLIQLIKRQRLEDTMQRIRDYIYRKVTVIAFSSYLQEFTDDKIRNYFQTLQWHNKPVFYDSITTTNFNIYDNLSEQTPKFNLSTKSSGLARLEELLYEFEDSLVLIRKRIALTYLRNECKLRTIRESDPHDSNRTLPKINSLPMNVIYGQFFNEVYASVQSKRKEHIKFFIELVSLLVKTEKLKNFRLFLTGLKGMSPVDVNRDLKRDLRIFLFIIDNCTMKSKRLGFNRIKDGLKGKKGRELTAKVKCLSRSLTPEKDSYLQESIVIKQITNSGLSNTGKRTVKRGIANLPLKSNQSFEQRQKTLLESSIYVRGGFEKYQKQIGIRSEGLNKLHKSPESPKYRKNKSKSRSKNPNRSSSVYKQIMEKKKNQSFEKKRR